ncbi:MAG: hypothetical protein QXU06_04550, partial [Candidatus Bathyarchaeia archaeon]
MSVLTGRVIKYPDNVNTDDIIPARYLSSMDMDMVARYAFEDYDPGFSPMTTIVYFLVGITASLKRGLRPVPHRVLFADEWS